MTLVLFLSGGEVGPPVVVPPTPGEEGGGGIPLVQNTFFWEEMYSGMSPLLWAEEENEFHLQKFTKAFSLPFELIHYLVRDDPETGAVGWSPILDPIRCPDELLPWLGQFVGVSQVTGESAPELRARMTGTIFERGTVKSIADEAARLGITSMVITERYEGNPYKILLTFDAAQYTGAKAYQILRKVPAGIVVEIDFGDGVTYADIRATYDDYADALASNTDYTDLRGG